MEQIQYEWDIDNGICALSITLSVIKQENIFWSDALEQNGATLNALQRQYVMVSLA
jgi:hypothetical protein